MAELLLRDVEHSLFGAFAHHVQSIRMPQALLPAAEIAIFVLASMVVGFIFLKPLGVQI